MRPALDTVLDPVCGMQVPTDSRYRRAHAGVEHRFCCGNCLAKFAADPARYTGIDAPAGAGPSLFARFAAWLRKTPSP